MIEALLTLSGLAIAIVEAKYPKEFYDRRYSQIIFEMIELVGDELVKKNYGIIIEPTINNFVNVKDLEFGDRVNFVAPTI